MIASFDKEVLNFLGQNESFCLVKFFFLIGKQHMVSFSSRSKRKLEKLKLVYMVFVAL